MSAYFSGCNLKCKSFKYFHPSMKNTFSRISSFSSVLFNCTIGLLIAMTIISHFIGTPKISSELQVTRISSGNSYRICEFIPNIDLKPQFNFNTKQIFLYLVLKENNRSEMIWHTIVKNGGKYNFTEKLRSASFSTTKGNDSFDFELRGSVFPFVGQLKDVSYATISYKEKQ